MKGWWDEEVVKAPLDRKKENRKHRNLARLAKRLGGRYEEEWAEAWDRYIAAKKETQTVISGKIEKWEREQAAILSNMPQREREKEMWGCVRRNLGGPATFHECS